jgi:DNA primase
MNIEKLYQDHGIDYVDGNTGGRHSRPGWVNTECPFPFCTGNPGNHLGYNVEEDYFYCWRCGGHSHLEVVSELLQIPRQKARTLMGQYGGGKVVPRRSTNKKINIQSLKHPSNLNELQNNHRKYLHERGFDAGRLEREWGLKGTGPISTLKYGEKKINLSHRIYIPIEQEGVVVSWQTRDVTGKKKDLKYITCPMELETVHHKHLLFGKPEKWHKTGILTEGVFDVFRLGPAACCGFGVKITAKQLRILAKDFDRVAVLFDPDAAGQREGKGLISELDFRGVEAFHVPLETDPGEMKQDDADHLVRQLVSTTF